MSGVVVRACYPGSFDPLTVAHVAVASAVLEQVPGVVGVDFVMSRSALGKSSGAASSLSDRCRAIEACGFSAVVTDAQLVVDVAAGYDVLVGGADKLDQVWDVSFYGGSVAARDSAVARLPGVLAVAPRAGFDVPARAGVVVLRVDPALAAVSSTAVRSGSAHWLARPAPRTRQNPE